MTTSSFILCYRRMVRNTRADTSVHSLSAWLEKYGKPSRQPEQQAARLCCVTLILVLSYALKRHRSDSEPLLSSREGCS